MAINSVGLITKEGMTTTMNEEIIDIHPNSYPQKNYSFFSFSFVPNIDCEVIVNGTNTIKIKADLGLELSYNHTPTHSFKVKTTGVSYYYIGAY